MLERAGHTVSTFTDSQAALASFKADPARYRLLISDQTMPKLSGMDLAREIFALRPDFPVLICTGHSEVISREEALAQGIRDFLFKPVTKKELLSAVNEILR